jgi:hypothetical protein
MKWSNKWIWLMVACGSTGVAGEQLQLLPGQEPQCVFSGNTRNVFATFHNPDNQDFRRRIRAVISQASSATVVPWGERS